MVAICNKKAVVICNNTLSLAIMYFLWSVVVSIIGYKMMPTNHTRCTKNLPDVCITNKTSVYNTEWVCLTIILWKMRERLACYDSYMRKLVMTSLSSHRRARQLGGLYNFVWYWVQKLRDSSQRMQRGKKNCKLAEKNCLEKLRLDPGVVHSFSPDQDFDWYNLEHYVLQEIYTQLIHLFQLRLL